MKHLDGEGKLTALDLREFLRSMFERANVKYKPDDLMVIVRKFIKEDEKSISPSSFLEFCATELRILDWGLVGKRLRRLYEKCELMGVDVEQLFAAKDVDGTAHISVKDLREVLADLSIHYRLGSHDLDVVIEHFASRQTGKDAEPISLHKLMAFLGKPYSGSSNAKLRDKLQPLAPALLSAFNNNGAAVKGQLPLGAIEALLRDFNVFDFMSHEQVKRVLQSAAEAEGVSEKLSCRGLCAYIGVALPKKSLSNEPAKQLTAEELLLILIDRTGSRGTSISEAFKHFDRDGDGFITLEQLEEGLEKLE